MNNQTIKYQFSIDYIGETIKTAKMLIEEAADNYETLKEMAALDNCEDFQIIKFVDCCLGESTFNCALDCHYTFVFVIR